VDFRDTYLLTPSLTQYHCTTARILPSNLEPNLYSVSVDLRERFIQVWCRFILTISLSSPQSPILLDPLSGSPHLLSLNKLKLNILPKSPSVSVCYWVLFVSQPGISHDTICFRLLVLRVTHFSSVTLMAAVATYVNNACLNSINEIQNQISWYPFYFLFFFYQSHHHMALSLSFYTFGWCS